MRILVATDQWFPDLSGGLARVAADTAAGLAARGHEIEVLAPAVEGLPAVGGDGVVVRRTLRRHGLPRTLADPLAVVRAARGIDLRAFDLAVAHVGTVGAGLVARRLPIPLAYVFHASAARELEDLRRRVPGPGARARSTLLGPVLAAYERVSLRRATRILLLSEFSRSLVEADHPDVGDRVRLVSGGVDVDAFAPGDGPDAARARLGLAADGPPLLLTVRRLEPRMGLEELLRAHADLGDLGAQLVVGGRGSLDGALRQLAGELGLADRVRFLGRVDDDELRLWYRAADVFVLPTQAYEGFGMVTAEALASGTPVVGTPVGATPELLTPLDEQLVASSPRADDLAAATRRAVALASPELRARCREYAVSRYAWSRVIVDWERALEEAAAA